MSETLQRLLNVITMDPSQPIEMAKPVQLPAKSLPGITADIRTAHDHAMSALVDSLRAAITAGKHLLEAKALLKQQRGHGLWQDYLAVDCGLSLRTAQNYMHLAKNEAALAPFLSGNTQGSAFSQAQALKFLGEERKKRKRRPAK